MNRINASLSPDTHIEFFSKLDVRFIHRHVETCVEIFVRLVFDCLDYRFGTMANVDRADSCREVDVLVAVNRH